MPDNTPRSADQQQTVHRRFNANLRGHLSSLITPELIEEHRQKPLGQHSDNLERLLNYFRRPPHYALYSPSVCREFQIVALPIARGSSPQPLEAKIYTDEKEALHAVFLKHIEMLNSD
jgi:branched-chain amino acid transport system permease protein